MLHRVICFYIILHTFREYFVHEVILLLHNFFSILNILRKQIFHLNVLSIFWNTQNKPLQMFPKAMSPSVVYFLQAPLRLSESWVFHLSLYPITPKYSTEVQCCKSKGFCFLLTYNQRFDFALATLLYQPHMVHPERSAVLSGLGKGRGWMVLLALPFGEAKIQLSRGGRRALTDTPV